MLLQLLSILQLLLLLLLLGSGGREMLDRLHVLLWHLLTHELLRVVVLFIYVDASRHQNEVEALDLLQVTCHTMLHHLALECLPVGQLGFLQASPDPRTSTSDSEQVPFNKGLRNVGIRSRRRELWLIFDRTMHRCYVLVT